MNIADFTVTGRVAVLTINNPPVNALSQGVRAALVEAVGDVMANSSVDALVIACAGKTFIAGADIREFGKPPLSPLLPEAVAAIENCAKPVVAAIHGTALGGGLEVALGCHGRVAVASAKLGLPEVTLGLLPGAGGTVRLPRLVGLSKAMEMITSGKPIGGAEAAEIGLVDRIADSDLVAAAVALAAELAQAGAPVRTVDRIDKLADATVKTIDAFAAANARKFKHLHAPAAILDCLRATVTLPFDEALVLERQRFEILRAGPQSAALRHNFFAERQAAKAPDLEGVTPRTIKSVGIIGAGTMGTGIAINFLLAGIDVTMVEQQQAALDRGAGSVRKTIDGNIAAGRVSTDAGNHALSLLRTSLDYAALSACDLIIEAAFETMEVKAAIFSQLDAVAKPGAILASNTSYLDLDAIAAVTERPEDVVGLHFFSPANVMKLLEVVRGAKTSPDVLATSLALAKTIKKVAVISGNAYGFIGNRMLAVRRKESETLIHEGASPYDVDRVIEAFGLPMGPFKIGDLAGLDLGWSAETSTGSTVRERLCEAGRRGQKTLAGFYDYDADRKGKPSQIALDIIAGFAADKGFAQRPIDDAEIFARLIWPMVDEGARILEDKIAQRASDIDVVWLNGYGWPAWTGGPMFYADTVGLERVVSELHKLGRTPSALLAQLASRRETFASFDASRA
jgi:3-hydroxyacyl-CoA dehydrogenase